MNRFLFAFGILLLASCQSDNLYNPDKISDQAKASYEEDWVKNVGPIDPAQNWNTVSSCKLEVTVPDAGSYTVKVYNRNPRLATVEDKAVLLGKYKVQGRQTSTIYVDIPKVLDGCYVSLVNDADRTRIVRGTYIQDNVLKVNFSNESAETTTRFSWGWPWGDSSSDEQQPAVTERTVLFTKACFDKIIKTIRHNSNNGISSVGFRTKTQKYVFLIYKDLENSDGNLKFGSTSSEGDRSRVEFSKKDAETLWEKDAADNVITYKMNNSSGTQKSDYMRSIISDDNFKGVVANSKNFFYSDKDYEYTRANHVFYADFKGEKKYSYDGTNDGGFYYLEVGLPLDGVDKPQSSFSVVGVLKDLSTVVDKSTVTLDSFSYLFAFTDNLGDLEEFVDTDPEPAVPGTGSSPDAGSSEGSSGSVETEPSYLVFCEDLGSSGDRDFNDVVFRVEHTSGSNQATITPLAAAGTLPAYLYQGDNQVGEVHSFWGAATPTSVIINGYKKGNPGASKIIPVSPDFSMANNMGNFKILVEQGVHKYTTIQAPEEGRAPVMLCIPADDWAWPKEGTCIEDAYAKFKGWNENHTVNTDWFVSPVENLVVK